MNYEELDKNLFGILSGAEKTLIFISNVILVLGLILTLYCTFTIVRVHNPDWNVYVVGLVDPYLYSTNGIIITVSIFISTLISSCVLKVLANISLTLKAINNKTLPNINSYVKDINEKISETEKTE